MIASGSADPSRAAELLLPVPDRGRPCPPALAKAPKTSTRTRAARSGRRPNRPTPERWAVVPQVAAGQARPGCRRCRAGRRGRSRGRRCSPCCPPCAAGTGRSSQPGMPSRPRMQSLVRHDAQTAGSRTFDLQRRDQRLDEVELADGAEVLAEGGAAEEAVDRRRPRRSSRRDPGRPPRAVPEGERLVGPEEQGDQDHRQPLAPQPPRPVQPRRQPAAGEGPGQQERARHAEDVAGREQPQDDQAAPVDPRQDAGQVHRGRPAARGGRRR